MSRYYETKEVLSLTKVINDIQSKKIDGMKIEKIEKENFFGTTQVKAGRWCIGYKDEFVWLMDGVNEGTLGIKVWGDNKEKEILELLSKIYNVTILDEEDLGFLHLG